MDQGYGDPDVPSFQPNSGTLGFHQDAHGNWVPNDVPYYVQVAQQRLAAGQHLSAQDLDMIARPGEYMMLNGVPVERTWLREHTGLAQFLTVGAFLGGSIALGAATAPGAAAGTSASSAIPTTLGIDATTLASLPGATAIPGVVAGTTAATGAEVGGELAASNSWDNLVAPSLMGGGASTGTSLLSRLAPILLQGGLGLAEGLTQQQPQQRRPFTGANDPDTLMSQQNGRLSSLYDTLSSRVNSPVTLPDATVQPLGSYEGGGLPMRIGVDHQPQGQIAAGSGGPSLAPHGMPNLSSFGASSSPMGDGAAPRRFTTPTPTTQLPGPDDPLVDRSMPTPRPVGQPTSSPQSQSQPMSTPAPAPLPTSAPQRRTFAPGVHSVGPMQAQDPTQAALNLLMHVASGAGA